MPIRWTSRLALAQIVAQMPNSRLKVYNCILNWPGAEGPSIEDIAVATGMKESSVCGRVNELKKCYAIEEGLLKVNGSGKKAMTYIACKYQEPDGRAQREFAY